MPTSTHSLRHRPHHLHLPPFSESIPSTVYFRAAQMPAQAAYPRHRHAWGEFVYAFSGVMEVKLDDLHYLATPQYGIWLPPLVEHQGLNRLEACHASLYVAADLCSLLPPQTCALAVNPLVHALLNHCRQTPSAQAQTEAHQRLLRTLVDQLAVASCVGSYLPTSLDPLLGPVLQALETHPGDPRSLAELAAAFHTTERTLMRRCQRDLGMPFAEWRQRLRVVRAMPLLEAGLTVENIAHDLGYSSASAFIAMFRRLMQVTPDEYRKGMAVAR